MKNAIYTMTPQNIENFSQYLEKVEAIDSNLYLQTETSGNFQDPNFQQECLQEPYVDLMDELESMIRAQRCYNEKAMELQHEIDGQEIDNHKCIEDLKYMLLHLYVDYDL